MVDILHFFWIIIFALGLGIVGGEIIADLNSHPPDKKDKNKKGGESDGHSR